MTKIKKRFKDMNLIHKYAEKIDRKLTFKDFRYTPRVIRHLDGSELRLTNTKYEKVRWTDCEFVEIRDKKPDKTRKGIDVHIIWTEHHGFFVYDADEIKMKNLSI